MAQTAEQTAARHRAEVARGERFEFGKNWSKFLSNLTVVRIKLAENSLKTFLQAERLDGKTFIDIGSGSGLFSLAARRLGAKVFSFDYDTNSYACTRELRRRYFDNDPDWHVEQGSVLDREYLSRLGRFDIVYSWGVIHHTGAMWEGLENIKPLVKVGGQLFIAIYNDLGEVSDWWTRVKRTYNALPKPLNLLYALTVIGRFEGRHFLDYAKRGEPREYFKRWTEYHLSSARGMSKWHDEIDWVGGYPFEVASIPEIVDFYARDGFRLTKLADQSNGWGCNEFVFRREAEAGVYVESPVPGGNSFVHRFGRRVLGPFERGPDGWTGRAYHPPAIRAGSQLFLFRDGALLRPVALNENSRLWVADPHETLDSLHASAFHIAAAEERPLDPPFEDLPGHVWRKALPDLIPLADRSGDTRRSPVFLYEGARQLPIPHAEHANISKLGKGRFAHWGDSMFFSTTDNSDPNKNGRLYRILIAAEPLPKERSFAKRFGRPVSGPFERTAAGWTAAMPGGPPPPHDGALFLLCDDTLVGIARTDRSGRLLLAGPEAGESGLAAAEFYVVPARERRLEPPLVHSRGAMYEVLLPEFEEVADRTGSDRRSSLFVFENGRQLPHPHALHDEIAGGGGRFSHWEHMLFFSASDGTDPNTNGREYRILVA